MKTFMNTFKEIKSSELSFNPFDIKDKEWMLISAEKDGKTNTMTASWGGFGILWNKEVAFVVIRPQRYTKEFVDTADYFSLSFLGNNQKKILAYLGKVSGRDEDKIEKAGLTVEYDNNIPYFAESETVIFLKKLYVQPMGGEFFIEKDIIPTWFPENDFHVLYIGEVTKILTKKIITYYSTNNWAA